MNTVSKVSILLAVAAIFQSCNEISSLDVNQDIIKPNYTLSYSEKTQRLEVQGSFTVDKTILTYVELEGGSVFRVNDIRVNKDQDNYFSTTYTYRQTNVNYEEIGTTKVSYFDVIEKEYTNNLRAPKKIDFTLPEVIDEKTNEIQFILPGGKNDGWISISIQSREQHSSTVVYPWEVETGKKGFILDKDLVTKHAGESINVTICYSESKDLKVAPGRGGQITYRYCGISKVSFVDVNYKNEEPVVEEIEEVTANVEHNL